MPESAMFGAAVALMLATAMLAIAEAGLPEAGRRERRGRRRRAPASAPKPVQAFEARPAQDPKAAGASREWLLDTLPIEPAGAPRDRAGGAGRLLIGITGMAIAGALTVLGISRGLSVLFDRILR